MTTVACMLLALSTFGVPEPVVDANAAEPAELWVAANTAYRAGHYDVAAKTYRELLAHGSDDGQVYYNLGNAEMRRGELALALAAFRAARARLPRDEDVAANLRLARARVTDAVAPPEPSTVLRTLFFWHYALSLGELGWICVIVNALFWSALLVALWWRRRVFIWLAAGLAVPLLALAPSLALRLGRPTTVAVVHRPLLDVYSGPDSNTVLRFRLHEGTEAVVTGSDDGWVRIGLSDGKQGWVPTGDVVTVRL